ncbi:octopamine receptor beta-2R [Caerostris darwini]|uniref:Octopamine receptor beta-2R n=1 Tax=Caerostris darwini TaxID=1538125 RepID=A0AAV4PIH3_9ARAC|nr:octopamine receptor beta-2R [Caerostris darwini]
MTEASPADSEDYVTSFINDSYQTLILLNDPVNGSESLSANATNMTVTQEEVSWEWHLIMAIKTFIVLTIIICAIFGNILVISSVYRNHKLRITTNYFVVSLAFADTLVALLAMTFNASHMIAGKWIFNQTVCDFWNSCDVLFSTASIMHLCCISVDRYYAIIKPLEYPTKITAKLVAVMIACVWFSSGLISFIPIFLGWYTTDEYLNSRDQNPDVCDFRVNKPYAIVSSSVSFWIPCFIMLWTYYKIYVEAVRQERFMCRNQVVPGYNNARNSSDHPLTQNVQPPPHHRNSHNDDPESGQSTPTKRTISKMKREHKAAKTLGIIMGAFILCWLPFFLWYVSISMCGDACYCPEIVVQVLFWIGYFNSSLNPIIYAYFNRDFREAFKETIQTFICCCCKVRCLQNERAKSMQYNCAYRSTQDIGLVENKYINRDC